MKHFGIDRKILLRKKEVWRNTLKPILFTEGDIVAMGKKGEESAEK